MGKFIISAILVLALANYAYSMGSHRHRPNWGNETTLQTSNDSGGNTTPGPGPVAVPEPATMLLLGSGLLGLWGLRKKVRSKF